MWFLLKNNYIVDVLVERIWKYFNRHIIEVFEFFNRSFSQHNIESFFIEVIIELFYSGGIYVFIYSCIITYCGSCIIIYFGSCIIIYFGSCIIMYCGPNWLRRVSRAIIIVLLLFRVETSFYNIIVFFFRPMNINKNFPFIKIFFPPELKNFHLQ